jgi:hypothetical protein
MRASSLDRASACPGSENMQRGLPDEESDEAREGTELHHFKARPELQRGVLPRALQDLLRKADELDEALFQAVIDNEKIKDSEEYVEAREVDGDVVFDDTYQLTGHTDLVRRYPRRGITVLSDYKFGRSVVPRAEFNMQLRGYGILSKDPTVYVAISQPRASYGEQLTIAKYDQDALELARKEISALIRWTESSQAPLRPGGHCRYCRARAICPALKAAVSEAIVPMDILSPSDSKMKKLGIVTARLAQATDMEIEKMLDAYSLIQFIHEPLFDEARRRIGAEGLVNWKLTKPVEKRKIIDSQKAIALLNLAGMPREEILKCATLSLTKLEQWDGTLKSGHKLTKATTAEVLNSVLAIFTEKSRILRK